MGGTVAVPLSVLGPEELVSLVDKTELLSDFASVPLGVLLLSLQLLWRLEIVSPRLSFLQLQIVSPLLLHHVYL